MLHDHFSPQLGEKPFSIKVGQMPLNQRVQGSNPCAPTTSIKHLADFQFVVSTSCQRLISTNSPFRSRFKSLACPEATLSRAPRRECTGREVPDIVMAVFLIFAGRRIGIAG